MAHAPHLGQVQGRLGRWPRRGMLACQSLRSSDFVWEQGCIDKPSRVQRSSVRKGKMFSAVRRCGGKWMRPDKHSPCSCIVKGNGWVRCAVKVNHWGRAGRGRVIIQPIPDGVWLWEAATAARRAGASPRTVTPRSSIVTCLAYRCAIVK